MRKIKFRGICADTRLANCGEYVYGDLLTAWEDGNELPKIRSTADYNETGDGTAYCYYYSVQPESVSQLIATDANNAEVYEGDKVKRIRTYDADVNGYIDCDTFPFAATFEDYAAIIDGEIVLVESADIQRQVKIA